MDTKEYLEQISMIDHRIDLMLYQIDTLTELTKKTNAVAGNMIVGADTAKAVLSPTVQKIVDLQKEYSQDMAELLDQKDRIIKAIEAVENDTSRTILQMRYVQCLQWQDIADSLCYDLRHVYRLHKAALTAVQPDTAA